MKTSSVTWVYQVKYTHEAENTPRFYITEHSEKTSLVTRQDRDKLTSEMVSAFVTSKIRKCLSLEELE